METRLNRPDRFQDKTFCDEDDPYVRDECMETSLNRPDRFQDKTFRDRHEFVLQM